MTIRALVELFTAAGMLYSGIVGIAQQTINRRARRRQEQEQEDRPGED